MAEWPYPTIGDEQRDTDVFTLHPGRVLEKERGRAPLPAAVLHQPTNVPVILVDWIYAEEPFPLISWAISSIQFL